MSITTCEQVEAFRRACFSDTRGTDDTQRSAHAWVDGVARLSDMDGCIVGALEQSAEQADHQKFNDYLLAAFQHPSSAYTPIPCAVLDSRSPGFQHEDIAELLEEIADPSSIDALVMALAWNQEWDECRWLASKCISALVAIGTNEALDAVRAATRNESEYVRGYAREALGESGMSGA